MALEGSNLTFDNILSLVHHYQVGLTKCGQIGDWQNPAIPISIISHILHQHLAGELPVLLSLPEILRETEGRHHLTSLARLARGVLAHYIHI